MCVCVGGGGGCLYDIGRVLPRDSHFQKIPEVAGSSLRGDYGTPIYGAMARSALPDVQYEAVLSCAPDDTAPCAIESPKARAIATQHGIPGQHGIGSHTAWYPTAWYPIGQHGTGSHTAWYPTAWYPTAWYPTAWYPTAWYPTAWYPWTAWYPTQHGTPRHGIPHSIPGKSRGRHHSEGHYSQQMPSLDTWVVGTTTSTHHGTGADGHLRRQLMPLYES